MNEVARLAQQEGGAYREVVGWLIGGMAPEQAAHKARKLAQQCEQTARAQRNPSNGLATSMRTCAYQFNRAADLLEGSL